MKLWFLVDVPKTPNCLEERYDRAIDFISKVYVIVEQ